MPKTKQVKILVNDFPKPPVLDFDEMDKKYKTFLTIENIKELTTV